MAKTNIIFLGSCQVGVYDALTKASQQTEIESGAIEVYKYKASEYEGIYDQLKKADIVVTMPITDKYGPLATSNLKASINNLVVISRIYFRGYHPDCVYLGASGGKDRWNSPIGAYNSKVVYNNWKAGRHFKRAVKEILEYDPEVARAVFDASAEEWLERERSLVDISAAPLILNNPELGWRYLHVFNHPTVDYLTKYLREIYYFMGIQVPLDSCEDPLAESSRFPVYPQVFEALGVSRAAATTDLKFWRGEQPLTLQEFCEQSYHLFNEQLRQKGVSVRTSHGLSEGKRKYSELYGVHYASERALRPIREIVLLGFPECIPPRFLTSLVGAVGGRLHLSREGSSENPAYLSAASFGLSTLGGDSSGMIAISKYSSYIYNEDALKFIASQCEARDILCLLFVQHPKLSLTEWFRRHRSIALRKEPASHFAARRSEFFGSCSIEEYYEEWGKKMLCYADYVARAEQIIPKDRLCVITKQQALTWPDEVILKICDFGGIPMTPGWKMRGGGPAAEPGTANRNADSMSPELSYALDVEHLFLADLMENSNLYSIGTI